MDEDLTTMHEDPTPMNREQRRHPDQITVQVPTAAVLMDVSRTTIYELIKAGKLESVKVGSRRLIIVDSIHAYIAQLRQAA